ncbi:protein lines-like [Tigriopus californicus]|uniref:protein lines-like n=1 Tax=Tigriopus californicus TaxID=6832 RepID=UPI0027D9EB99|nr:protein lines-like [Tigriopus californicus]
MAASTTTAISTSASPHTPPKSWSLDEWHRLLREQCVCYKQEQVQSGLIQAIRRLTTQAELEPAPAPWTRLKTWDAWHHLLRTGQRVGEAADAWPICPVWIHVAQCLKRHSVLLVATLLRQGPGDTSHVFERYAYQRALQSAVVLLGQTGQSSADSDPTLALIGRVAWTWMNARQFQCLESYLQERSDGGPPEGTTRPLCQGCQATPIPGSSCRPDRGDRVHLIGDRTSGWLMSKHVMGESLRSIWKRQGRDLTRLHGGQVDFLSLWRALVSVQSNLGVSASREFQSGLKPLLEGLPRLTDPVAARLGLDVLHEVLCYGSTLALQDSVCDGALHLAKDVLRTFEEKQLEKIAANCPSHLSGFLGTVQVPPPASGNGQMLLLESVVLLVVKAMAVLVREGFYCSSSEDSDTSLSSRTSSCEEEHGLIERKIAGHLRHLHELMVGSLALLPSATLLEAWVMLFLERDDAMLESMLCLLDIHALLRGGAGSMGGGAGSSSAVFPGLSIDPVWLFHKYMSECAWDGSVLLDFLLSKETCCLLYLLRFLKYLNRQDKASIPRRVRSFLGEFHGSLLQLTRKELFPYDIKPLLEQFRKLTMPSPSDLEDVGPPSSP